MIVKYFDGTTHNVLDEGLYIRSIWDIRLLASEAIFDSYSKMEKADRKGYTLRQSLETVKELIERSRSIFKTIEDAIKETKFVLRYNGPEGAFKIRHYDSNAGAITEDYCPRWYDACVKEQKETGSYYVEDMPVINRSSLMRRMVLLKEAIRTLSLHIEHLNSVKDNILSGIKNEDANRRNAS